MIEDSKKVVGRWSLQVLLVVGFVLASSTPIFAETDYYEEDVGIADIYEDDVFDSDATYDVGIDGGLDVDFDSGVNSDTGIDGDAGLNDDADHDAGDVSEGVDAEQDDSGESNDAGADFLFVELGVEVQFDGDAPDVVKLGLHSNFGEVAPIDVSVSEQGTAVWDVEDLRAGAWVLSVTADGYEPVEYRFIAGDLSQMLIRVSMSKLGSHADAKVESGWACSSVASDTGPSMLILFAVLAGSMWVQRRRNC